MKVTVFNGSPAGSNSATNVIAEAFLEGASDAGAVTENIFLADYHVEQCQGCFGCWFKTPGKCVLQDDMAELLELYNESDIVCFATPVYTWNMTALLKNFVDRLAPLKSPKIQENQGNFDLKDGRIREQKFVVLSNCGFPGKNNFDVLQRAVACCNPSLEIYRNCGKLLKSHEPEIRERVAQWLEAVKSAGSEMVLSGVAAEATRDALEMELMSIPEYVSYIQMG
ncbi:MAG: flavodoxin family protein [Eubacteriales bacterium]|nr:flavodoxin family protein [Eubacteriales bacterium]